MTTTRRPQTDTRGTVGRAEPADAETLQTLLFELADHQPGYAAMAPLPVCKGELRAGIPSSTPLHQSEVDRTPAIAS